MPFCRFFGLTEYIQFKEQQWLSQWLRCWSQPSEPMFNFFWQLGTDKVTCGCRKVSWRKVAPVHWKSLGHVETFVMRECMMLKALIMPRP